MWFREFRRALFRPVRKRLARTFATRSDTEALRTALEHGLARHIDETGRRIEALNHALGETDRQIRLQIEALNHALGETDRQIRLQIGYVAAGQDGLTASIARMEQMAGRDRAELGRLETGEQFSRQAIHDIASRLFGGPELANGRESSISVVIPSCDRADGLRRALESVAAQSRKPNAVVVVNDGHADISKVLQHFSDRLAISSLKTDAPRSGSSAARNRALDAVDTELVAFLDDDNLMWPCWLERAAAFLEADPRIDIVYGAQLRDAESSTTRKDWFLVPFDLEALKRGNFIDINQIMHRASHVRFDPTLRRLVDWDYVLRLIGSKPTRIVPVDAISSVYSTSGFDRVTVARWPPDVGQNIARRETGEDMLLPGQRLCPCCWFTGAFALGPRQRPNAACPRCGSLERHRFLQLVAPTLLDFWLPGTRPPARATMIEVAPSASTAAFRSLFGASITVDADPEADGRTVDVVASLTDLPLPSECADVLLALHVLEHIPQDRRAMAEIARILAPTGVAVLQVPMSGRDTTDEEPLGAPEERSMRYGQADHVRLYGDDFYSRLGEAGLASAAVSPRRSMQPESIAKYGLLPDEPLVFAVRSDMRRARASLDIFASLLRKGAPIDEGAG